MKKHLILAVIVLSSFFTSKAQWDPYQAAYVAGYQACLSSIQNAIQSNPNWSIYGVEKFYKANNGNPNISVAEINYQQWLDAEPNVRYRSIGFAQDGYMAAQQAVNSILYSSLYQMMQQNAPNGPMEQGTYDGYNQALVDAIVPPAGP
jgi:hypothetical protein